MRKMFRCTSPLTRACTTLPASYSDIDSRTSFKKPVRGAPHDETPLKSNTRTPIRLPASSAETVSLYIRLDSLDPPLHRRHVRLKTEPANDLLQCRVFLYARYGVCGHNDVRSIGNILAVDLAQPEASAR